MKRRKSRVYWRERGGVRRAYGDFRDYADVGGKQMPLRVNEGELATTDPDVADKLAADWVQVFEKKRRGMVITGVAGGSTLTEFASHHLVEKKKSGEVTDAWLSDLESRLTLAVEFFGADRDLSTITVRDVGAWLDQIRRRSGIRGKAVSGGTLRHYLNALAGLYVTAQAEGVVLPGFNPARALPHKPRAARKEAEWLEVHEAALLLESARRYTPATPDALPFMYELIATMLLTGGRRSEVLGLQVSDISFDNHTITFRPNKWRRLKTLTSRRAVPLWPQLEEILRPYVFGSDSPPRNLLFPATRGEKEAMVVDVRKALDQVAMRAGWEAGEVRTKALRHAYCSARLQTYEPVVRGKKKIYVPVSQFTVAREMGHGGDQLVKRIYGHLGTVKHRSDVVEYRISQHRAKLRDRLALLRR